MNYGIPMLRNNYQYLHYIVASRSQSPSTQFARSDHASVSEYNYEDYPQPEQEVETHQPTTEVKTSTVPTETKTEEQLTIEEPTKIITPTESKEDTNTARIDDDHNTSTTTVKSWTPTEMTHLTKDIVRAIACASTMRRMRRHGTKVSDFLRSLRKEVGHKCHSSRQYELTTSTELNHQIALAREIAGSHTTQELTQWESRHTTTPAEVTCLLHFHRFCYVEGKPSNYKLTTALHEYAKSVLTSQQLNNDQRTALVNQVQSQLTARKFTQAYAWFNSYKPNSDKFPAETESQASTSERTASLTTSNTPRQPHVCPAIRDETDYALEFGLSECITRYFRTNELSIRVPPSLSATEFLQKVISEVVKHNANWNIQSFVPNEKHITKALYDLDITISNEDRGILLWTIIAILPKLKAHEPYRKQAKE